MILLNRCLKIFGLLGMFLIFQSCQKENIELVRPIHFEIYSYGADKNLTETENSFLRGTYFYYDLNVESKDDIVSYTLALIPEHQESTVPFYYSKYHAVNPQRTLSVSDSLWVPDKCGTGIYRVVIAYTDAMGHFEKVYRNIEIVESHPNPISIIFEEQPIVDIPYTLGSDISIGGEIVDLGGRLSSVKIFLVRETDYYADPQESIVMYSTNSFANTSSLKFTVSMKVGELLDHDTIPKEIADWNLGKAYIVVVAKNADGYLLYSKHCPLQIQI